MMRVLQILLVVFVWSITPILKRAALDYMKYPADVVDVASPVRTFVALNSFGCALAAIALAVPTEPMQFVRRLPSEGWAVLLAGVGLGTVGGLTLVELLSQGNPGTTMVYLNAGTNILTYLSGAVLYGEVTWEGCTGVMLVAAGITLIKG